MSIVCSLFLSVFRCCEIVVGVVCSVVVVVWKLCSFVSVMKVLRKCVFMVVG